MLGEQRRIERRLAGAISERVDTAAQGNDLPLRHPARKLQQDCWPTVGKRLHQERQVKADQAANEIDQALVFHMRHISQVIINANENRLEAVGKRRS